MPQEIPMPAASPRGGSFKPGDSVTIGGKTFEVVATSPSGEPVFRLASGQSFDDEPAVSAPKSKAPDSAPKGDFMARIMSERDKIMALPDGVRESVLDKLFDKTVGTKIPKSFNDSQRSVIKQRFMDSIAGQPFSKDPGQSPEDYARAGGMPHGSFGVARGGILEGLAGILHSVRSEGAKLHYGDKGPPEGMDKYADKGLVALAENWLRKQAGEQHEATAPYEARSKQHSVLGIPFDRTDIESGSGRLLASAPLDLATSELIPGTGKGASLLSRIASSAGKGAIGGGASAPAFNQSVSSGAVAGGITGGLFPLLTAPFTKGLSKISSGTSKAAAKGIAGITEDSDFEKFALKNFQKPLKELTPDQKIELVNKWRDESTAVAKTARETAKKAAAQKKIDDITSKAVEKADQRVATRKAMDEAKAFQKRISEFVKTNKRAPNEQELAKLKAGEATATPVAAAAKPAAAADAERGIKKPERRTFLRTEDKDVKEFYSYRFQQIRDEIKNAATPEEKAAAERRLAALSEVQKAHPTSMGDAHDFKVESPEAVKAVASVADVSKAMSPTGEVPVTKVPEGQSGLSPFQQTLSTKLDDTTAKLASATDPKVASQLKKTIENIKQAMGGDMNALKKLGDAERKSGERARAAAAASSGETASVGTGKAGSAVTELVSSSAPNPEEALIKAEEEFYDLTDKLESTGARGKEVAKKLNEFWKKPPKGMSRQQVIEAGEKALGQLQGAK